MLTNWSPYSPDLNPIEHLWYGLKKLIYQVRPSIDSVTGSDNTFWEALWKALEETWTLIDIEIMKKLIGKMERRIKAVIAVDGWYTKY